MDEPRKVELPADSPLKEGEAAKAAETKSHDKDGRIKELEGAVSRMIQHLSDTTHESIDSLRKKFHPDHAPKK